MFKKNLYGEKLKMCEKGNNGIGSSSVNDNTCSEMGGGVHQICVRNIGQGKSFSKETGQQDWSSKKGINNHCACLGAWALYVSKGHNDKFVKCDAIPDTIFNQIYQKNWSTWNGLELDNQAEIGLKSIYDQCIKDAPNQEAKQYLKSKYYTMNN
ncbi:MAG: hypothetical protein CBD97_01910 [Pelagibacteraceae bacterium TMED237]|nr:MAG: hypothetical protein CBD97_01910 [Pelagibacteraceae bacterium TMED237]|tara:strand:+ start:11050 stop:11511 length:462 start_codon:yes stop_codon:yes gene_type:complete